MPPSPWQTSIPIEKLFVLADPLDEDQLRFTFEEADGFAALPTMPVVLAWPGFWIRDPESGVLTGGSDPRADGCAMSL